MGGPQAPSQPSISKEYQKMINIQLKNLPAQLQGELAARQTYDPQFIAQQQAMQAQYGPTQYAQQLQALQQLDPQGTAIRQAMGTQVQQDLAAGYNLGPLQATADSEARARAALTGNEIGNSADINNIIGTTQFAQQLHQQRLAEAARFQSLATPEQQIQNIAPVNAPDAFRLVNPSAGLQGIQAGQQQYANQLAAWQAAGSGSSGLAGTIGSLAGAVGGAYLGTYLGNPMLGAQVGGSLGGYTSGQIFSDARLKNHIEYLGRSAGGHPIYEFNYDDIPDQRFRGTIAQELLKTAPDACSLGDDGFWRVDYGKIDIKLEEVAHGLQLV